jgi:hypothetical protein
MFAATVATLTDLGFLWFREFYLESSRVIQVRKQDFLWTCYSLWNSLTHGENKSTLLNWCCWELLCVRVLLWLNYSINLENISCFCLDWIEGIIIRIEYWGSDWLGIRGLVVFLNSQLETLFFCSIVQLFLINFSWGLNLVGWESYSVSSHFRLN